MYILNTYPTKTNREIRTTLEADETGKIIKCSDTEIEVLWNEYWEKGFAYCSGDIAIECPRNSDKFLEYLADAFVYLGYTLVTEVKEHLPGKHAQKTHGRRKSGEALSDEEQKVLDVAQYNWSVFGTINIRLAADEILSGNKTSKFGDSDYKHAEALLKAVADAPPGSAKVYRGLLNKIDPEIGSTFDLGLAGFTTDRTVARLYTAGGESQGTFITLVAGAKVHPIDYSRLKGHDLGGHDEDYEVITGGHFKVLNVIPSVPGYAPTRVTIEQIGVWDDD